MKKMKIIFAGTGSFAANVLEELVNDSRISLLFVITAPDKEAGRGLRLQFSPVKEVAIKNKIIVHQPQRIDGLRKNVMQEEPDLLLVVDYGQIINNEILQIPKVSSVNIHPSLLPLYRGSSPIQEAILHGDRKTGVTWIKMTAKMDAGPVISQITIPIEGEETAQTLSEKLSRLAATETTQILLDFLQNGNEKDQEESKATYCKKIEKRDGQIYPENETAEEILRKIRAYTPWPGCYISFNGKRLKIIQAKLNEQKISAGKILRDGDKFLAIGTKNGSFSPTIVQPESKKSMSIGDFLRGQRNTH